MAELSLAGVFFPSALLWAVVALAIGFALRRVFAGLGLYRFVWHRALFDLAVFILLLGGTVGIASRVFGP